MSIRQFWLCVVDFWYGGRRNDSLKGGLKCERFVKSSVNQKVSSENQSGFEKQQWQTTGINQKKFESKKKKQFFDLFSSRPNILLQAPLLA